MTSFKKRTQQKSIPGTKTSLYNGQLITSSGNPSMDHIIGGGLPVGSLIMIEEDKFVTYSKVLAKYFLAEGIFSGQSIFLGSLDDDPDEFVKKLPKPVEIASNQEEKQQQNSAELRDHLNPDSDDMRIAWRYNELPVVNSEQSSATIGHNFNLTEQIDKETLETADVFCWRSNGNELGSEEGSTNIFLNPYYTNLLLNLSKVIQHEKFLVTEGSETTSKSLLRICLTSMGSPLWLQENFNVDFIKFVTILKSMVRCHNAVCFITIPMHLTRILDATLVSRIRNLMDVVIELESFAGSEKETNPVFKEYHGLLNIRKMSALNSLAVFTPETTDLAFKLRRKKFVIEKLHLPPELGEPEQNQPDDIVPSACGSLLLFSGFYLFSDNQRILLSRLLASTSEQLNELPQPFFYYIALGLVAAGMIAILAAIIGFWASCLNTYCFLSFYFLTIIILLLAESAVCLAITIWPQCLGLNFDETKMVKALQGFYGVPGREQFTIGMDLAQTKFHCCGMNSDINYDTALWRLQSYGQRDWTVPLSCCKLENTEDPFSYLDPIPVNGSICQSLQKFDYERARHIEPCLEKLDLWYRDQYVLFLAASLVIAVVEFCVLLSIILSCTKLSRKPKTLDEFHEMQDRRKSTLSLVENIYEPEIGVPGPHTITSVPSDVKDVYVQPPNFYKNKHNTTFKPSKNHYHISQSYVV